MDSRQTEVGMALNGVSESLMASEKAVRYYRERKKKKPLKLKERKLLLCAYRKFCKTTCDKVASGKCI